MRRLIVFSLLALCACTPEQHQAWISWFDVDPRAAVAFTRTGCGGLGCEVEHDVPVEVSTPPDTDSDVSAGTDRTSSESDADIGWGQCSQWMGDALDAGWSLEQWSTLSWIMAAESGCDPGAYNPSGARGLLQVMGMWADDCGGSPDDLFSPWFNLSCGLHVYGQQGWSAWSVY